MLYFFQTLSLKTRFVGVLLLFFPVLLLSWLLTSAPWALASLQALSGGAGVPDQGLWYTPAQLQTLLTAWGAAGRELYYRVLFPTDLGFLVAYGAFLGAATLYLLKKSNPASAWWYLLPLVPLSAAGFDLLENLAVASAVALPAEGWEPVAWTAAVLTLAKWLTIGLSVTVLLVGTATTLVRSAWAHWKGSDAL